MIVLVVEYWWVLSLLSKFWGALVFAENQHWLPASAFVLP